MSNENKKTYLDLRQESMKQINDLTKKIEIVDEEFLELRKEIELLEQNYKHIFDKHFTFRALLKAIHRLTTEYITISENIKDLLAISNSMADENAIAKMITSAMDALFKKKDIINDIIGHINDMQKLYNDIYKAELKANKEDLDDVEQLVEGINDFGNI